MSERPILFSASMVRAILDGTKTQTRRVVKVSRRRGARSLPFPPYWTDEDGRLLFEDVENGGNYVEWSECSAPHGRAGETLWVKEGIRRVDAGPLSEYIADGTLTVADYWPWKLKALPGMFCPRSLSRITLRVESHRIERLQAISEADALAEGVAEGPGSLDGSWATARAHYAELWDSINGKKPGHAWADNPWVHVVTFSRIE